MVGAAMMTVPARKMTTAMQKDGARARRSHAMIRIPVRMMTAILRPDVSSRTTIAFVMISMPARKRMSVQTVPVPAQILWSAQHKINVTMLVRAQP